MLFLICEANGQDSDVYVHKDDKRFITRDGEELISLVVDLKRKITQKLFKPTGASPEEIEARKKEQQEKQSRLR